MRWIVVASLMLFFSLPAFADALPNCPEGQMPDCEPSEHHHGCGGCVDDPSYEGSGCAAAGAASFSAFSALLVVALLRRRRA